MQNCHFDNCIPIFQVHKTFVKGIIKSESVILLYIILSRAKGKENQMNTNNTIQI